MKSRGPSPKTPSKKDAPSAAQAGDSQNLVGNAAIQSMLPAGGGGEDLNATLDQIAPATPEETAAEATAGPSQEIPHREEMEEAFGEDLGHLDAHVGAGDALAEAGAGALQSGDDLAFASTNPEPEQVAHEVAHSLQGGGGGAGATEPGDSAEQEASSVGAQIASGEGVGGQMHASRSGGVAMDWLDDASPSSDAFWGTLRGLMATELSSWLANVNGNAATTWADHMQSKAESSSANLVIDSIITAIGAAGDTGSIVGAVLSIGKAVYVHMASQYPAGTVGFHDFLQARMASQAAVAGQISGRSHPMFTALTALEATENAENRAATRQRAITQVRAGYAALPTAVAIQQALTQAWVNGAQDGADWGDFNLDNAGYFYVRGIMVPPNAYSERGWYNGVTAQLDDTDRPDGTIEAIRQAWGSRTPLQNLPFAIDLELSTLVRPGRFDVVDGDPLVGTKSAAAGAYSFTSGTQAHQAWFLEHPTTTADIVAD